MNRRSRPLLLGLTFCAACYSGGDGEDSIGATDGGTDTSAESGMGPGSDSESDSAGETGDDDPPNEDPAASCESSLLGPPMLRRLTRAEYEATILAIFPELEGRWGGTTLGPDPVSHHGFDNDAETLTVGTQTAAAILETAEDVASLVVDPGTLQNVLPCATAGDSACAQTFIETYGAKIFRRPLTAEELGHYTDHYQEISSASDFATGIKWSLVGLLQSPHAVYRSELGSPDGEQVRLTPHELASALSYSFSGGPPTDALLAKAEAGELDSAEARVAEARELLATPGGQEVLDSFFRQWLGYAQVTTKVRNDVPQFETLRPAMVEETRRFVQQVVVEEGGDVTDLLTAAFTFLTPELASFYGYGSGDASFAMTDRPSEYGAGLLAQGSILATYALADSSSPTQRGLLVYERLLCREVPPPPDNIPTIAPPQPGATTTRERYEVAHAANPSCTGCHANFDPLGFAFEHFDRAGRYRADESGLPIDASGSVRIDQTDVAFDGLTELSQVAAELPRVTDCASGLATVYLFGGGGDTPCLAEEARAALRTGDVGLLEFVAQLAAAPHFATRD